MSGLRLGPRVYRAKFYRDLLDQHFNLRVGVASMCGYWRMARRLAIEKMAHDALDVQRGVGLFSGPMVHKVDMTSARLAECLTILCLSNRQFALMLGHNESLVRRWLLGSRIPADVAAWLERRVVDRLAYDRRFDGDPAPFGVIATPQGRPSFKRRILR